MVYWKHKVSILALYFMALLAMPCGAATLKALILAYGVPPALFSQEELSEQVEGAGSRSQQVTVVAYRLLGINQILGHLYALSYDQSTHRIVRAPTLLRDDDLCSGSIESLGPLGGFTLLSTHISPSAGCILVLGRALKRRATLYGFSPVEIAPGMVVILENMIHFAPVHPERLQLAELATGETTELYSPQGDRLRAQLSAENARQMPAAATCMRMNDPCEPGVFDEDLRDVVTTKNGVFAFIAVQSASHLIAEQAPPKQVASQTVLYIYKLDESVTLKQWRYCQGKMENEAQVVEVEKDLRSNVEKVAASCIPTLDVLPDRSTALYNPFLK